MKPTITNSELIRYNKKFLQRSIEDEDPKKTTQFTGPEEDKEYYYSLTELENGEALFAVNRGKLRSYESHFRSNEQAIIAYRKMAEHPLMKQLINEHVNEAMHFPNDPYAEPIKLTINSKKLQRKLGIKSDEHMQDLHDAAVYSFDDLLLMLNMRTEAYNYYKHWFIDGRIYFECIFDLETDNISSIRYIDPLNIVPVKYQGKKYYLYDKTRKSEVMKRARKGPYVAVDEYQLPVTYGEENRDKEVRLIPESYILYANSGETDANGIIISHLHNCSKPLNHLIHLQDAVVVYRLSRAPSRRIVYVDIGGSRPTERKQIMRTIAKSLEQSEVMDMATGQVMDRKHVLAMTQNVFIPRINGNTTEIDELKGGENLGEIRDVDYFRKELIDSLGVPKSRFYEGEAVVTIGSDHNVARDEIPFAKLVQRYRQQFAKVIWEGLKRKWHFDDVTSNVEIFKAIESCSSITFEGENYYFVLKQLEMLQYRMNIFDQMQTHIEDDKVSETWAMVNILNFTPEDLVEMKSQRIQELEDDNEFLETVYKTKLAIAEKRKNLAAMEDPEMDIKMMQIEAMLAQPEENTQNTEGEGGK